MSSVGDEGQQIRFSASLPFSCRERSSLFLQKRFLLHLSFLLKLESIMNSLLLLLHLLIWLLHLSRLSSRQPRFSSKPLSKANWLRIPLRSPLRPRRALGTIRPSPQRRCPVFLLGRLGRVVGMDPDPTSPSWSVSNCLSWNKKHWSSRNSSKHSQESCPLIIEHCYLLKRISEVETA